MQSSSESLWISSGKPTKQKPTHLESVDGRPIYVWDAHTQRATTEDSEGVQREAELEFVAANIEEYDVILGYPWLRTTHIDFDTKWFRHKTAAHLIETQTAKQFAKTIEDDIPLFVAFFTSKGPTISVISKGTDATPVEIPIEYADFKEVFDDAKAAGLPGLDGPSHAIELEPEGKPPWGPVYALAAPEMEALREYLEDRLDRGWIRRSKSPAGAPVLFTPKKDGGLRLCIDYRGLNKITIKNRTPLPLIMETLDRLGQAAVFTKLDLKDAYNRIRIQEGDEWKTASRTRYGPFEYTVMHFGLCNAPATFQQYINEALAGLVDVICVVYLDDILIYSERPEEHTGHVRQVLERLQQYNLFVNLKKCDFNTEVVEFLGYIITPDGIAMEPARIQTIRDWPKPTSVHDIQVFLGFANFYRRFIRNYSRITAPITNLLRKKDEKFMFDTLAQEAFLKLKFAFTRAPVLRHFDPQLPIRLETDASGFATGAVISQLFGTGADARWHPIAFHSKKMSPEETRYETHDQELLAIVQAFRTWRHYLSYTRDTIAVLTDHNNLRGFMTKVKLNGRQVRWAQSLSEFDFNVEYRPGKLNPADGPSRRPDYSPTEEHDVNDVLPSLKKKLQGDFVTKRLNLLRFAVSRDKSRLLALRVATTRDEPTRPNESRLLARAASRSLGNFGLV